MPLCPQITNTPITVVLNADFTVTSVIPVLPATTTQLNDVVVLLDDKTKAYYQTTAPTTGLNEGDIWFDTDDGNKQYFYSGTAWVSVQDTAIAAAQSTADGKNKVFRQTSAPTASASGDLWFDTDDDNRIYRWSGTAWVANDLGTNALANFSANKITSGSIDASVVTVSNINAGNISTGSLASARIAAGTIIASQIATGTITATQIATGTITATQIAAGTITTTQLATGTLSANNISTGTLSASVGLSAVTGTIGGFTITSTNIYTASLDIQSTGSIIGGNSSTLFYGYVNIGGGTAGSERLIVTGNSNLNGTLVTSGTITSTNNIISDNHFYTTNASTTSSSANAFINTLSSPVGRLMRSTSSLRYKTNITPQEINPFSVLQLIPKSFNDKKEFEDNDNSADGLKRYFGLIAEEVAEISDLANLLVTYDDKGRPDSVNYDRIGVALIPLLNNLNQRLIEIEGK
jgi:Chaperone of endosialidase